MTNEQRPSLYCPVCQGVHPIRIKRDCYQWLWLNNVAHELRIGYCKHGGKFLAVIERDLMIAKVYEHHHRG